MTDVTASAKLQFTHRHGGSGRHYYVETMSGGCAFFDYDGDGWQDIFLPQGGVLPGYKSATPLRSALYHNNQNGTFTNVTKCSGLDIEMYALAPAVGDYDNDGKPDLFVTALGGNRLFHNLGGGKFQDVTQKTIFAGTDLSFSAAWLDYDRDGWLDLFVCRYTDYSIKSDKACKDANGKLGYCHPTAYKATSSRLYHNKRDGTFADVTQQSGILEKTGRSLGVACADYNEDGWTDIYVTNDMSLNYLFMNNGNGTFSEEAIRAGVAMGPTTLAFAGMGVDCGDYTNEGRQGLVVTNFDNEPISLYRNTGTGSFMFESDTSGMGAAGYRYLKWGVRFVDLDLDGWQDLFVVNGHVLDQADKMKNTAGYAQPCQVFHSEGGFRDISAQSGSFFSRRQVGRGAAFGDYDNDGDTDILIACNNQPAILLRNDSSHQNGWIRLALQGKGCNRDALGARVQVSANSLKQTQYVRSGTSYLADHDRRLLFGIGQEKQAQVEVRWPCGNVQTLNVQAGKTQAIQEIGCKLIYAGEK